MRIAVPDLVSPSYFPAVAACTLARDPGPAGTASLELVEVFPIHRAYQELRDGNVEFVAGPAHAALRAFPEWNGAKVLMALSQHTYWLLVAGTNTTVLPGELGTLRGMRIAAASGPAAALRQMIADSGIDAQAEGIEIGPLPESHADGSFGVAAARALRDGVIDAFWANGMAAEIAVRQGAGRVVLDPRRGMGGEMGIDYTFPALVTTDRMIAERRDEVRDAVAAVLWAQEELKSDPGRAAEAAAGIFEPDEIALISDLIRADLPYYDPEITEAAVAGLNHFCMARGLIARPAGAAEIAVSRDELLRSDV